MLAGGGWAGTPGVYETAGPGCRFVGSTCCDGNDGNVIGRCQPGGGYTFGEGCGFGFGFLFGFGFWFGFGFCVFGFVGCFVGPTPFQGFPPFVGFCSSIEGGVDVWF
jgi:hypothetical protein